HGWGMAGLRMSPRCWCARPAPSSGDWSSWMNCRTTRLPGACGGREVVEKKVATEPQLAENLQAVLAVRTAGDPDDEAITWTDLSPRQIAEIVTALGTPVSPPVVRDWLEDQGLGLHKIAKDLAGGVHPERDAQFQRILDYQLEYFDADNPVFSIDTKAKE